MSNMFSQLSWVDPTHDDGCGWKQVIPIYDTSLLPSKCLSLLLPDFFPFLFPRSCFLYPVKQNMAAPQTYYFPVASLGTVFVNA